jgi:hypothetical protein
MKTAFLALALMVFAATAHAQAPAPATAAAKTPAQTEPAWEISASLYAYSPPDSQSYLQPTIRADRGKLHLEARYNYEALDTSSVWIGYNFSFGDELKLDLTPMLGGVFGKTSGLAPGYELTLAWRRFQLYSEGEYVFDKDVSSDSYFYMWSEVTYAPTDWFQFGLVGQRTRAYQTEVDTQRGLLARVIYKKVDFTGYVFNPGTDYPTYVVSVGVSF